MIFARVDAKIKAGLVALFGLLLMGAFFLLGYKYDFGKVRDYFDKKGDGVSAEVKVLRSQREIIAEYRDNLTNLSVAILRADDYQEILLLVNAGFLDIYVPNLMRELHLRAFLNIKRFEQSLAVEVAELKDFIKAEIEELLRKNNELERTL